MVNSGITVKPTTGTVPCQPGSVAAIPMTDQGQQLFHNIQPLLNGLSTPMERITWPKI
ncbi:hypothetical protein L9F63_006571, partial [Diploptera punctata]